MTTITAAVLERSDDRPRPYAASARLGLNQLELDRLAETEAIRQIVEP